MPPQLQPAAQGAAARGVSTAAAAAAAAAVAAAIADAADEQPLITGHSHGGGAHGHHMRAVAASSVTALTAAIMLEFGLSVHSIFIGLAVGVVGDGQLTALLTALSFHQFFEGISLGARLFDTDFSLSMDSLLAAIFSVSAPAGMAIGVALIGSGGLDTAGPTFLLVQGTLDSICAGILLYIGFSLLLADFPADVRKFGAHGPRAAAKRATMFAALWLGGGLMAYIGLYL